MLPPRKTGKFQEKYCNLTRELITLEELGFKEDWHNRWNYVIRDDEHSTVSLLASGNSLYLREQEGNDVNLVKLYDRSITGSPMSKHVLYEQIERLRYGLVEGKKTSKRA